MDEFMQIGPEKGDYDADVLAVAAALNGAERAVHVLLTHRLTQQSIVVCLKEKMELLCPVVGTRPGRWLFVARPEYGAYWFQLDFKMDPGYVASKLGINPIDAETLTDFMERIARAIGIEPVTATSVVRAL